MLKTLTLILFPQLNPYHKTSARLALYIQFFGIECRIFNFYLYKPQNKMFHFCKTFCSKITLVNTIQNVILNPI